MQLPLLSLRATAPVVKSILRWESQLLYARKNWKASFSFSHQSRTTVTKSFWERRFFIKRILKCFTLKCRVNLIWYYFDLTGPVRWYRSGPITYFLAISSAIYLPDEISTFILVFVAKEGPWRSTFVSRHMSRRQDAKLTGLSASGPLPAITLLSVYMRSIENWVIDSS